MKQLLRDVILSQRVALAEKTVIERTLPRDLVNGPEIVVICGPCGIGKGTMLQCLSRKMKEYDYLVDFDDPRLLHFTEDNFDLLMEVLKELYGEQHTCYFIDIALKPGFAPFVRRLHDKGYKVFLTCSNEALLDTSFHDSLDGYYVRFDSLPLSFREYVRWKGTDTPRRTNGYSSKAEVSLLLEDYYRQGGIPEYLTTPTTPLCTPSIIVSSIATSWYATSLPASRRCAGPSSS